MRELALPEQSSILEELVQKGYLTQQNTTVRQIGDATQRMVRLKEDGPVCKLTVKQQAVYDLLSESGVLPPSRRSATSPVQRRRW